MTQLGLQHAGTYPTEPGGEVAGGPQAGGAFAVQAGVVQVVPGPGPQVLLPVGEAPPRGAIDVGVRTCGWGPHLAGSGRTCVGGLGEVAVSAEEGGVPAGQLTAVGQPAGGRRVPMSCSTVDFIGIIVRRPV